MTTQKEPQIKVSNQKLVQVTLQNNYESLIIKHLGHTESNLMFKVRTNLRNNYSLHPSKGIVCANQFETVSIKLDEGDSNDVNLTKNLQFHVHVCEISDELTEEYLSK